MNKNILLLLFFCGLFLLSCEAQIPSEKILKKQLVDLAKYPIYSQLTELQGDTLVWKPSYQYLDDINIYGITYWSDGLKIRGLMVKPREEGKYPCIIYNRGGNPQLGLLRIADGAIRLGQMAREGYVVIASQYRGAAESEGQDEFGGKDVNDVLRLIDVLGEEESADTSKIGMYGWSRGGMMTYIALTKTSKIDAVAVGGALSDNLAMIADRPEMGPLYAKLIPNYDQNKEEVLKERSALYWVDRFPRDVPILLLHGNADWRVKPEQSLRLALAFEQYRIPYRLMIFEGGNHGIREHRAEVNEAVLSWFNKFLKENAPLPNMEYHGN